MSKSTRFYGFWRDHHGKVVKIDGLSYRLRCSTYQQRYPYPEEVIDVAADPVSKSSAHYREVKARLGDDWSTDVLASDIDVQVSILRQLETM